jgi:hypothetical protein
VVVDDDTTHKHAKVQAWLTRNPRVQPHAIATDASWRNLVEVFFTILKREALRRGDHRRIGTSPEAFPSAIAMTWLDITEDTGVAERTLGDLLASMLGRPAEALGSAPLPIGPAAVGAERLAAYVAAGVRRVVVWPLADEARRLVLFGERVASLVPRQPWRRQDQHGCRCSPI